jgi:hypothetical protein
MARRDHGARTQTKSFTFPSSSFLLLLTLSLLTFFLQIVSANALYHRTSQDILLKANSRSKIKIEETVNNDGEDDATKINYPKPSDVILSKQCTTMPLSVCVGSKETTSSKKLFTPNAKSKSLTAWYNFDDALGYDNAVATNAGPSPSKFLITSSPKYNLKFAPGYGGVGGSIRFDGGKDDYVQVPSSSSTDDEMTVSFWIFLRNKPISSYNMILRKGSEKIEFTPTIQITSKRKLHVRLRQINDENQHGHSFQSYSRVPYEKWTHVALVLQGEIARMYVNGVRDNMIVLNDRYRINQEPWFLGGMPGKPGINAFVDDFKVHNEGLGEGEIQAMCHGALGSMSARNIRFLNGGK